MITQYNANGIFIARADRVQYRASDPAYDGDSASLPAIIGNNSGAGIVAQNGAEIACASCQIIGNTADGVTLDLGAHALFRKVFLTSGQTAATLAITDNGGVGVSVGDLSSAELPFDANNGIIQRNGGQYQITYNNVMTSVTRRALLFATAGPNGTTNCTN